MLRVNGGFYFILKTGHVNSGAKGRKRGTMPIGDRRTVPIDEQCLQFFDWPRGVIYRNRATVDERRGVQKKRENGTGKKR